MKILWSWTASGTSGAIPQAILLSEKLKERGIEVTLMHLPSLDVKHNHPYFESEFRGVKVIYPTRSLFKAIKTYDPDLFFCHTLHGSILQSLKGVKKANYPVVARVGINLIEILVMGVYQLTLPGVVRLLRNMDHIICAGTNTVKQIRGLGIPLDKISWIPTVIDKATYTLSNCLDPCILIMGRVAAVKNHITMIQAFKLVKDVIPESQLAIVGAGGELIDILDNILKEIGLGKKDYKFTGYMPDVTKVFPEVSVFCLPSLSENLPQSILEAYASGIPCILSDAGWSEIFESPLKAKHHDPQEWAEKIIRLLTNKEYANKIRNDQLRELDEKFNLETALDNYVKLFKELIL